MEEELPWRIHRTLREHQQRSIGDSRVSVTTERLEELKRLLRVTIPAAPDTVNTIWGAPLEVDDTLPADPGYAVTSPY